MSTAEILSTLTPRLRHPRARDRDDPTWQDIIFAMQGTDPGKFAFMMYAYADDPGARHNFFAGLFMEVMADPITQVWIRQRREGRGYCRWVESLCLIAVTECKDGAAPRYTQEERAKLMGVSRSTWRRKHRDLYEMILAVPARWEDEVMEIVTKRLR